MNFDRYLFTGYESLGDVVQEKYQKVGAKFSEENEKLVSTDGLSDVERLKNLLSSASGAQRICGLRTLLRLRDYELKPEILAHLNGFCSSKTPLDQLEVFCKAIESILKRPASCNKKEIASYFFPLALKLLDSKDFESEEKKWKTVRDTFFVLIDYLPFDLLKGKLLEFTHELGKPGSTSSLRPLLACQILGAIGRNLKQREIGPVFFSAAKNLCQDTDYEVRCCMCEHLFEMAQGVGRDESVRHFLPELLELLKDDAAVVKHHAFRCYVDIYPLFDALTRITYLLSYIRNFLTSPPEEVMIIAADLFGRLLINVKDDLEPHEVLQLYELFKSFSSRKIQEIRIKCAFNLPAVVQVMGPDEFMASLKPSFLALCRDENTQVRKTVASGIHEVLRLIGPSNSLGFVTVIMELLKDRDQSVRNAIFEHVADILGCLDISSGTPSAVGGSVHSPSSRLIVDSHGATLLNLTLEHLASINSLEWRRKEQLILQFQYFHSSFNTLQICDSVIPVILNLMSVENVLPVRVAATISLCQLIRWGVRSLQKRKQLCEDLIIHFGQSKSYWDRLLFVNISIQMADVFSRKFFKECFFFASLKLAEDRVATVRLKACSLFFTLKKSIILPQDSGRLRSMNTYLLHLKNDPDKDVAREANIVADQLNSIQLGIGGDVDLKEEMEEQNFTQESAEQEDMWRKDEDGRSELRRKLAEKEAEIKNNHRIFGSRFKGKTRPRESSFGSGADHRVGKGPVKSQDRSTAVPGLSFSSKYDRSGSGRVTSPRNVTSPRKTKVTSPRSGTVKKLSQSSLASAAKSATSRVKHLRRNRSAEQLPLKQLLPMENTGNATAKKPSIARKGFDPGSANSTLRSKSKKPVVRTSNNITSKPKIQTIGVKSRTTRVKK